MSHSHKEFPVIALYRIPDQAVASFSQLIKQHAPLLQKLRLISEDYRLFQKADPDFTTFIEIFAWASADSADIAHTIPEVNELWSTMEDLCESYNGLRKAEFWQVEALS